MGDDDAFTDALRYVARQAAMDHASDPPEAMREDPVGGKLGAVRNDRPYRGGGSYQGPVVNLFQTEAAARQFYPDAFGEWNGIETLANGSLGLFDRQRVADIVNGEF